MYLLYLDDSGSPADKNSQFFVFAGVAVFERQTHWADANITTVAKRFNQAKPEDIEFHAGPMRTGADGWEHFSPNDRVQATVDILNLLNVPRLSLKVFGAVIEKSQLAPSDIVPRAFSEVARLFDNFLADCYHFRNDPQRGIIIFDESDSERTIQGWSHVLKHKGHAQGKLRNFAEVPLFIDSKASRLIQLADMVAYWIYRRYQALDFRGYDLISPHFYQFSGSQNTNGLVEVISQATLANLGPQGQHKHPFPPANPPGTVLPAVQPKPTQPPAQTTI